MGGHDVLPAPVLIYVFDKACYTVRFQTDLQFIEQRNVPCTQGFFLQTGHEHAFRSQPELAKGHVAVVQR